MVRACGEFRAAPFATGVPWTERAGLLAGICPGPARRAGDGAGCAPERRYWPFDRMMSEKSEALPRPTIW